MSEPNVYPKVIIVYASVDGHTRKICSYIKDILERENHAVEIYPVEDFNKSFEDFDKIIIASSVRYGLHSKKIEKLIEENSSVLNSKKATFVSVNLIARKVEKCEPDQNTYVRKFLESITWKPIITAVFAGKLNYKLYNFTDTLLIKLIMLITKGPVSSKTNIEYTDWEKVDEFVRKMIRL